jgi:alanine dehydrogenase
VPKEIKDNENRVALSPSGVHVLVKGGHRVLIESGAGSGSGFSDEQYQEAGAQVVDTAQEVWQTAEMVMKVKEPEREEFRFFRPGLVLFTFLHLAAEPDLTKALLDHRVTAIAYETIQREDGSLPLLMPMSEVAGRMAVQVGIQFLEKPHGGKGILIGGVPGVSPGRVVVIGGGVVGSNAVRMAVGLGAHVTLLDINADRLRQMDEWYKGRLFTLMSNSYNIEMAVKEADLVIGAVLIPGARAPKLVTEEMVKQMSPGSVIVDVAVDQGGSVETIDRRTTHSDPVYIKHGVIHYAVANMPGAVPRTSTIALTNVTVPYALKLANQGITQAIKNDKSLFLGVNTFDGAITYQAVAEAHRLPYTPLEKLL